MKRFKILWIDDEHTKLEGLRNALKKSGFDLTCCNTVEEGVRAYNRDYFDAIILDRNVPRQDIIWPRNVVKDTSDQGTGEAMWRDVGERQHLRNVPILFLTQYTGGDFEERVTGADKRVRVLSKNENAVVVVRVIRELISQFPQDRLDIVSSLTDDYRVAAYYVSDLQTNRRVQVDFDSRRLAAGDIVSGNWLLKEFYYHLWQHSSDLLEAAVNHQSPHPPEVLGIYYTGKLMSDWRMAVMFEVEPSTTHASKERRYAGVGKAMVVRFLRECMRELNYGEKDVILDRRKFEDIEAMLHHNAAVNDFLSYLGFRETDERNVLVITHGSAVRLIEEVSRP